MPVDTFFQRKTDWARRKHLILDYYLKPAVNKLAYGTTARKVVVLDGFAGRGRYEEGSEGSPIYTGRLAQKCHAASNPINLLIRNVEPDPQHFQELEASTSEWVQSGYVENLRGTFQETLPNILRDAGQSPLFAFLDPFRHTQLEFNDLLPLLHRQAPTEICAVFFTRMVQRNLQALRPSSKAEPSFRATLSQTMTKTFGNNSWQNLISNDTLSYEDILNCLARQIEQQGRLGYMGNPGFVFWHPVFARQDEQKQTKQMQYHIVFWTRHPEGMILINDAFVKELGDLDEMTETQLTLATEKRLAGQVLLDFSEPDEPSDKDVAAAESFKVLCQSIIEICRSNPSKTCNSSHK